MYVWCNARNVHVRGHLADERYSNLWDGVISNAWLNILEGVWKNWKSWDPSRLGAAYIRHGVAADREKNQKRLEWENIRESRKKKRVLSTSLCRQLWLCHRHLGTSCSCSLLYQDLLWDPVKLLGLPSLFRATALPWTTFSDHQNLQNLRTFGLH